ncbi:MAG: hypothetical protein CVU53_04850 [Deltaproteobacteria bacterium HGW-Deltaproteobacteria-11]|nr:MAG: hypothetical protein CVU53_04850 [Deltaproteobacteria bacterium HGW-Deltaproteobacteria-11]
MACRFNFRPLALGLLLTTLIFSGCVSMRFDRINNGSDVPSPAAHLQEGTATLAEVLSHYGAPTDIVDMEGKFALLYKRSFYQGGQISIGIPLSDLLFFQSSVKLEATGNLLRHDLLALFFTPDGILAGTMHERGASHPFWGSFWK